MGFYKKTIFLKNTNSNDMALLTIEKTNSGIFGSLKGYGLSSYDDMVLGISVNGKGVVKQNIFFANDNVHTFKLSNDFDIDGNIGCVLVQNMPTTVKPLVWGSNNNKSCFKEDIIEILKEKKVPKTKVEKESNDDFKDVKLETKEIEIKKNEDESKSIDRNTNTFSEEIVEQAEKNTHLYEDTPEDIEQLIDSEMEEGDFYDLIKDQIDDLFARFPRNEALETLVDNSKWVTINYDNMENDYVVGLLYDEVGNLEFIAYGVPGSIDNQPPSQIIEYSQWLPLDPKTPSGSGYWVMFQDALTGDSVRLKAQDIS